MADVARNSDLQRPVRAHAYTRVSTVMQASEGTSLEVQEELCRSEAKRQGWELVQVHSDRGISGAKADRPALTELLEAVHRDEVDVILVSKLDRLGRSMRNLNVLYGELDDLNVILVSVTENFDSSTMGRMMRTMLSAWGEMERENISERTRSGTRKRVEMGGWVGGRPPYGYQVDATGPFKKLVPDPKETIMIHTVLTWLLDDGVNVTEICKRLNSQGMLPRKGGLWNTINLRNFLQRNQFDDKWTYAKPSKRTSGTPLTITVPAIVDPERMADLRAYLAATSTPHKAGTVHPLSGKLTCACGANMYGLDRGDRENRRYRCINSNRKPGKPYCNQPSVLANQIENAVMQRSSA